MDTAEILNRESIPCKTENKIENPEKIKIPEVTTAIESEQMKGTFKEIDVNGKPEGSSTKEEVKNVQHLNVFTQRDETNLCNSLLKKNGKIKHKIVSGKNPVKIQKRTKFGKIVKDRRQRPTSLRRKALLLMTRKKKLLQAEMCFQLFYEKNKSQVEFQDLQNAISRTTDTVSEEMKSIKFGNLTKLPLMNKTQFHPVSKSPLQEVSKKPSYSSKPETIISSVTTKSLPQKVRSAKEVWEHFIWFLRANKGSFDGTMTDGVGTENMKSLKCANRSLIDTAKTSKDSSNQNLKAFTPKTECVMTLVQDNLNCEISAIRHTNSVPFMGMIHQMRCRIIKEILKCEEFLKKIKLYGQQDKNMVTKINCLSKAKDFQTKLHHYFDVLCDPQKVFNYLNRNKMYSVCAENSLSNPTRLTDLPLSETHIRTFSSLFLYLHKSLYFEVPTENIFKMINSKNYVEVYRRYRKLKAMQRRIMETSKDIIKLIACFCVSLQACRLQMKLKIPHSKNLSLEVYQKCCIDLRVAISENLNCLQELLSAGSSVVFPVANYLSESRKRTLETFLFLDKWRTDIFPSMK